MKYLAVLFLSAITGVSAQIRHELPFDSQGNRLDLTIENTSTQAAADITVTLANPPSWLRLNPNHVPIAEIPAHSKANAGFLLTVERSAPIQQPHFLSLTVTSSSGQSWKKNVFISVAPPTSMELYQNYPNPFNPSTTIEYQLASESVVQIRIYDLLGREIARLADTRQSAGLHRASWNAEKQSSGFYFYELTAEEAGGNQTVLRRAMTLMK